MKDSQLSVMVPKQRIDGTAALLDCYVGLYEHYNEYTTAI